MDLYFLLIFLLCFLVYCLYMFLYPNNKEFCLVLKLIRTCSGLRLWSTVIGWPRGRPRGAWLHVSTSCTYRLSIRRSVGLNIISHDMHKQHTLKTLLQECFPVNQLGQSMGRFFCPQWNIICLKYHKAFVRFVLSALCYIAMFPGDSVHV